MPEARKLATILALDVAGYARAAERDASAAAETVRDLRASIIEIVAPLGGRIFNSAGDGFMLEFPSATAAVRATMALLETPKSGARPMPRIRIGVHLGEVSIEHGGDLLGHGVNVAARLQALADPDTAVVSEAVHAQVRSMDGLTFTPQGRVQLDKMSERLSVYRLAPGRAGTVGEISRRRLVRRALAVGAIAAPAAAGVAGWSWWRGQRTTPATTVSLAVIPFKDVGESPSPDYITQGLAREIRDRLSRVAGLRVIADTASFLAAAEARDSRDVGRRLGADLLVGGAIRTDAATTRIAAELVDARTAALVWTRDFDGPSNDVGVLERSISGALIEHFIQTLGPDRIEALTAPQRMDAQSYLMLLEAKQLGQQWIDRRMAAEETSAIERKREDILSAVLDRDPENAVALVLLAQNATTGKLPSQAGSRTTFQNAADGVALYRRALQSDPNHPAALTGLAEFYRRYEWRWLDAKRLMSRALAIDPNDVSAHISLAYLLSQIGGCREALRHAKTALLLEPGTPRPRFALARVMKTSGALEESDRLYRAEFDATPRNAFLLREIHLNHVSRGDTDSLRRLATHARDTLWNGKPPAPIAALAARSEAAADALEGRPNAFVAMIEADVVRAGQVTAEANRYSNDLIYTLAIEAAAAGATERAIDLLEQALRARSLYIPDTFPYGLFEFTAEMRAHTRYQALWRSEPALVELTRLRLENLRAGEMAGVLPDGRRVLPRA